MAAALAYVFSGRDSAELWGCKDPGSGPWIELLYRQELATLQEWFGACAWERVDAAEEAPWDDSAVPPYGSYTMRLLSDGDIILHWNSPYVAVYLDGEGQIGGGGHGGSDLDAGGARPGGGAGGCYRHRRLRILPHDLLPWESGLLLHG